MNDFASYDNLPAPVQSALNEIKQLIYEVDGKTLATPGENGCFIDNGIVVASDLADSFNTLVAALTPPEPTEGLRADIEHLRRMKKNWRQIMARHPALQDTVFLTEIDRACDEIERLRAIPLHKETREQALVAARAIDAEYLSHVSLYARQSENGINNTHLRWMVEQMADMSENKTQRWLGYIQGVLVAQGRATLADMKELNRRAMVAEEQTEAKS